MKVQEFMSSPVFCVRPDDDLVHARKEMIRHGVSHLPVVADGGTLLGVLSLVDLAFNSRHHENPPRERLALPVRRRPAARPMVGDVFTRGHERFAPGMSAEDAVRTMAASGLSFLPVTSGGAVVGCVSAVDALRALGSGAAGTAQVKNLMRDRIPSVPRHASAEHVLRLMEREGVTEVAVLEGQAFITDRPEPTRDALRDRVHHGRDSVRWGIAGRVNLMSVVSSAWFDEHRAGWGGPKRIVEARKAEAGGRKQLRHVELVEDVVENMMDREVPALDPEDDASTAAQMFGLTGASGMPVVGAGMKAPGYLARADLLAHVAGGLSLG